MPTSEAFVETGRADRYVAQFAKHFAHEPGGIQARTDAEGRLLVDFGAAICTMQAQPDGLLLLAEAPDEEALGRLQHRLTERIEQIGHREGLAVRWNPAITGPAGMYLAADRTHHTQHATEPNT